MLEGVRRTAPCRAAGAVLASNQKLYMLPQRSALALGFTAKVCAAAKVTSPAFRVIVHASLL
jgi:hypothetical protein